MTKTEFLTLLEQRLMVLNDEERADLLGEYEQHIEMKVESGLSEEEAIQDFGDPEELIKELLDAYHLNTDYQPSGNTPAMGISHYVKNCAHFMTSVFDTLFHYKLRDLFKLFLQACFLAVFLGAILLCGAFIGSLLYSTIGQFWIGRVIYDIICLLAWIAYIALSVYMIVFFIKRYILVDYKPLEPPVTNGYTKEPASYANDFHIGKQINHAVDSGKERVHNLSEQTSETISTIKEKAAENKAQRAAEKAVRSAKIPKEHTSIPFPNISLGALCMKLMVWCCKCIAFFFLIGAGLCALALLASSAAMLVFVCTGYQIIGPFLVILGCTLFSLAVTGMLAQFIFGTGGANV